MGQLTFHTYEVAKHNPFERFPKGTYIAAEADQDGLYTLHIRFDNGLGLSSENKLTLYETVVLAFRYLDHLNFRGLKGTDNPNEAVYIEFPDHVLEKPDVFNHRVKKLLQAKGYYWKDRKRGD